LISSGGYLRITFILKLEWGIQTECSGAEIVRGYQYTSVNVIVEYNLEPPVKFPTTEMLKMADVLLTSLVICNSSVKISVRSEYDALPLPDADCVSTMMGVPVMLPVVEY